MKHRVDNFLNYRDLKVKDEKLLCFLGLVVEEKTSIYNFTDPRFESWVKQLFFSFNFLLG